MKKETDPQKKAREHQERANKYWINLDKLTGSGKTGKKRTK